MSARGTVGRDDIDRSAKPAHGIAKLLLGYAPGADGLFHDILGSSTSCGVFDRKPQDLIVGGHLLFVSRRRSHLYASLT
jgi:hypothetical protein